jgi:8-hydroxy-5-deazaflavin:NADPH oxidoreductase
VSSASVIAGLLPSGAHFVKAFGTVSAEHLAGAANRSPDRAVLFYATDDDMAAATAERLISAAGFAPVKAGGLDQAIRIEMFGDLHDFGGLNGKLLTVTQARAVLAGTRD